jgi:hypothetical protein
MCATSEPVGSERPPRLGRRGRAGRGLLKARPEPGAGSAGRGVAQRRRLDLVLMRGIRQVRIYLRRRRACLRIASTFVANAVGSMIGVPRHGDTDSKSVSLETISSAPTSAARSRMRLSS